MLQRSHSGKSPANEQAKKFFFGGGGGRGVGEVGGFPENCMKTEATEQQFVFMG